MIRRHLAFIALALALLTVAGAVAQFPFRFRRGWRNYDYSDPRAHQDGPPTPEWKNAPGFETDVFTFVRIRYSGGGYGRRSRGGWNTDWPDADLNLAWRLQQMTSLKVDPNGKILDITDPELFRHPFIYFVEPGDLEFSDEEAATLRRYLLNGGFAMFDDFWGDDEWDGFEAAIKQVFPDREIVDLPRTHPIFHNVFDLPNDLNLQCPNVEVGTWSERTGVTWERTSAGDTRTVHFRGILDDKGRLCVMICHNTDNGDGWEREGENEYYFREFSEKKAYPLMINIIFYAMTH